MQFSLQGEATFAALEADAAGKAKGPRRFEMMAYGGGEMLPRVDPPLKYPVIVDLAAMEYPKRQLPALKDHDRKRMVGHVESVKTDGKQMLAAGVVSGAGPDAKEVLEAADNGYQWPVSIGMEFGDAKFVPAGQSVQVNGRIQAGPVYVTRKGRLKEISFLTIGADDDAVASIAAEAAHKGEAMSFTDWLAANGFQPEEKLADAQKGILRASYDASEEGGGTAVIEKPKPKPKPPKGKIAALKAAAAAENDDPDDDEDEGDTAVTELRAELDGIKREATVYRLCGEKHPEIAAKALKEKWGDDMIKMSIEAAELRAALPQAMRNHGTRAKDAPTTGAVLEAACALTGNLANADKVFDPKALNEASDRYKNGIGLQELIMQAAYANGYTGHGIRQDLKGVLRAAFDLEAAQFSTISLPGIFANTANKFLLDGFMFVDDSWRAIAATGSATDFRPRTGWRLTGNGTFEEVAADGEIPHGTLGEESFENRVRTYGKMYGITRQDITNDDMNVLTAIPRKLGRGAKLGFNTKFWDTFKANVQSDGTTTFFADPSQNYLKGATTDLTATGLALSLAKFRAKTDADNEILAATPKILLVPPALEFAALQLMQSSNFNTGGAATGTQIPNANIWANRFTVVVSDYLADQPATTYYLLADPRDIPTIEVLFLNGRQQPTIETSDADFNTLGVLMRGYFDFGIALADARGGLKVKGAA